MSILPPIGEIKHSTSLVDDINGDDHHDDDPECWEARADALMMRHGLSRRPQIIDHSQWPHLILTLADIALTIERRPEFGAAIRPQLVAIFGTDEDRAPRKTTLVRAARGYLDSLAGNDVDLGDAVVTPLSAFELMRLLKTLDRKPQAALALGRLIAKAQAEEGGAK